MTRYINKPFLLSSDWLKQDYKFDCALNCLQQCFYNLTEIRVSEKRMLDLGYTSCSGTDHEGIKAVVRWFNKTYGKNIKVEFRNLSSFGSTLVERWDKIGALMVKPNVSMFAHIKYHNGGSECPKDRSRDHGHYEVFDIVNTGTLYIRALNSLSGGYLQDRKISVEECFMKGIDQPSLIILTKQ